MWFCDGYAPPHSRERVLPDGSVQLVISLKSEVTRLYRGVDHESSEVLRGPVIAGAHSQFVVLDTAEQKSAIGVHFKPGGALCGNAVEARTTRKLSNVRTTRVIL
jgi:hypothetical protein